MPRTSKVPKGARNRDLTPALARTRLICTLKVNRVPFGQGAPAALGIKEPVFVFVLYTDFDGRLAMISLDGLGQACWLE